MGDLASSDEVQFRDGMHGMLVWALSIVAGGLLAFLAAGAIAGSGTERGDGAGGRGMPALASDDAQRPHHMPCCWHSLPPAPSPTRARRWRQGR